MNKAKLAEEVSKKIGMSKKEAIQAVEITFDSIKNALKNNETVDIYGFGKFVLKRTPEKIGYNPKKKEKFTIFASKRPAFKASKNLKREVDK